MSVLQLAGLFSPVPGDSGTGSLPFQFAQLIFEIPDSVVHPVQFGLSSLDFIFAFKFFRSPKVRL